MKLTATVGCRLCALGFPFALCKIVEVLLLLLAYALMLDCPLKESYVRDEIVVPVPVAHQAFLRMLAEARREGGYRAAGVPRLLRRRP